MLRIKRALLSTLVTVAVALTASAGCPQSSPTRSKSNSITPEARAAALSIFAERCAVCHGVDGGGEGPAASSLNPKPANFRSRKWQSSMTDDRIAMIIVNGGTSVGLSASMASNPDLQGQPTVVAALVERIRKFAK